MRAKVVTSVAAVIVRQEYYRELHLLELRVQVIRTIFSYSTIIIARASHKISLQCKLYSVVSMANEHGFCSKNGNCQAAIIPSPKVALTTHAVDFKKTVAVQIGYTTPI